MIAIDVPLSNIMKMMFMTLKDNQYFIYEIIVGDNKGNLYYLDSDYMNENFSFDPEHDSVIPIPKEEE